MKQKFISLSCINTEMQRIHNNMVILLPRIILEPGLLLPFCHPQGTTLLQHGTQWCTTHSCSMQEDKEEKVCTSVPFRHQQRHSLSSSIKEAPKQSSSNRNFISLSGNNLGQVGRLCSMRWSKHTGWRDAVPSLAHGFHLCV